MHFREQYAEAPELRVSDWIDEDGAPTDGPVRLADLGAGHRILYCFQHWCPGCHSHGFPTLRYLHDKLGDRGFGFAAIQTVFEGSETNTIDKLRANQLQYELKIPFGHDVPPAGEHLPTFMQDYRSGGTPWFTVIDPDGHIVHADFRLDTDRLLGALDIEIERA